jgi:hypothetical protein
MGCEADHSPPSRAFIKNGGAVPLLALYAFMVWTGTNLSLHLLTVIDGGIVLFTHAPLQKNFTYL